MKVSMIVPCRNGADYLRPFLLCVAGQRYRPLQLVFIDDGSEDDTMAVFRQMRPLLENAGVEVIARTVPQSGQAAAVNAGLPLADGELLTWADADDFLLSDAVGEKARFLQENPDCGMVRHDAWNWEEESGVLTGRACSPRYRGKEHIFRPLFDGSLYCYAGCYMIRRSLFDEGCPGGKIPESREGQNLQMLLPSASRTRCGWIDRALMVYRIHPGSHAHRKRSMAEQLARLENFRRLRKEILRSCDADRETYEKLADEIFLRARTQLVHSAVLTIKKKRQEGEG